MSATPDAYWRESPKVAPKRPLIEIVLDDSDEGKEEWTQMVEEWARETAPRLDRLADFIQSHGVQNIEEVIEALDEAARQSEKSSFTTLSSAQTSREIAEKMRRQAQASPPDEYADRFNEVAERAERQALQMERRVEAYYPVLRSFRRLMEVLRTARDAQLLEMAGTATSDLLSSVWGADAEDL